MKLVSNPALQAAVLWSAAGTLGAASQEEARARHVQEVADDQKRQWIQKIWISLDAFAFFQAQPQSLEPKAAKTRLRARQQDSTNQEGLGASSQDAPLIVHEPERARSPARFRKIERIVDTGSLKLSRRGQLGHRSLKSEKTASPTGYSQDEDDYGASPTKSPKIPKLSKGALSAVPSNMPSGQPSAFPSTMPSNSNNPSLDPSGQPSSSTRPSLAPSGLPSESTAPSESGLPSLLPSSLPSDSTSPSNSPSNMPSESIGPSVLPSNVPSVSTMPSRTPSFAPSLSVPPSSIPSTGPSESGAPSEQPSATPSVSLKPFKVPSGSPSVSNGPSVSAMPSSVPSGSNAPSFMPSVTPCPASIVPAGCFTGNATYVTSLCAANNASCCEGFLACQWAVDPKNPQATPVICPGACQGQRACENLGPGSFIARNACVGKNSCVNLAMSAIQVESEGRCVAASVGYRSCVGGGACKGVASKSSIVQVSIGNDSCTFPFGKGYSSCGYVAAFATQVQTVDIGNFVCVGNSDCTYLAESALAVESVSIGDYSCTSETPLDYGGACYELGRYMTGTSLSIGSHSCLGTYSCNRVGFEPRDITIGTSSCTATRACRKVGRFRRGNILIGTSTCNATKSCESLAFGAGSGGVTLGDSSCTQDQACLFLAGDSKAASVFVGDQVCIDTISQCSGSRDPSCLTASFLADYATQCVS